MVGGQNDGPHGTPPVVDDGPAGGKVDFQDLLGGGGGDAAAARSVRAVGRRRGVMGMVLSLTSPGAARR